MSDFIDEKTKRKDPRGRKKGQKKNIHIIKEMKIVNELAARTFATWKLTKIKDGTMVRALEVMLDRAINRGDTVMMKYLLERFLGKVRDEVNVTGDIEVNMQTKLFSKKQLSDIFKKYIEVENEEQNIIEVKNENQSDEKNLEVVEVLRHEPL